MLLAEMLTTISDSNHDRVCREQYQRIVRQLYKKAAEGEKEFSTLEYIRKPVVKALKSHGLKVRTDYCPAEYPDYIPMIVFTVSWK